MEKPEAPEPDNTVENLDIVQRRAAVAASILIGLTSPEIAQQTGYPAATVSADFKAIIKQWQTYYAKDIDKLKQIQLRRLDVLIGAIWGEATKGTKESLPFMDRVVALMERQAKLIGLDAPQKFDGTVRLDIPVEQMTDADLLKIAGGK